MFSKSAILAVAAALAVQSGPSAADSLGFRFADVMIGGQSTQGDLQSTVRATADFAITQNHGLQLDLGVVGYGSDYLGQIDGHLYMTPNETAKYGLYFSLADMNGREATIGVVGVEAMFALSDSTTLHGRAGLGMSMPGNAEFITASAGLAQAIGDQVALLADVTVTEFDEASFSAVGSSIRLGISYQPEARPWEIYAGLARDGLTGRDAAAFETRAELGFTLHLGAGGGAKRSLATRGFASPQPLDPLLRRGLF